MKSGFEPFQTNEDLVHELAALFSTSVISLMDDIDPVERHEYNKRVMDGLRASFGLPPSSELRLSPLT